MADGPETSCAPISSEDSWSLVCPNEDPVTEKQTVKTPNHDKEEDVYLKVIQGTKMATDLLRHVKKETKTDLNKLIKSLHASRNKH